MSSSPEATSRATARKQALQDHVLATIQGRRLAGIALAMGLGKTLIGLRDMARLLAGGTLPDQAAGKPFLVAAPTQAILDSWPQEARKFGLAHLLDRIDFSTYRSLGKALAAGTYHKLYLDEHAGLAVFQRVNPGLRRMPLGTSGLLSVPIHVEIHRIPLPR
jgi:superfamily II DNA or RNA helicase